MIIAGGLVVGLAMSEFAFRLVAGERLLYRSDPEIEYLPLPNQAVRPRGVDTRTNEWGMRAAPASPQKPADAFRILAIGDSVVFGYTNIGHEDLATTRLGRRRQADGRRIEVLNASASSWGPGNMLAWLQRFGSLDADVIVLVLSTHDLSDDRTFRPPERDAFPQSAPVLALADWIWRKLTPDPAERVPLPARSARDAERSLPTLLSLAKRAPGGACLVIHATADEFKSDGPTSGELRLSALAQASGLGVVLDRDFIGGVQGFADGIHLSESGQADLERAMLACPQLAAVQRTD